MHLSYPKFRALKADGSPAVGYKLYFYAANSSTPQDTYTDHTQNAANTNPAILDSNGEAAVWLDPSLSYKAVLKTDADVTLWTMDEINAPDSREFLGDSNFYSRILSSNPVINFDENDYLLYERSTNVFQFLVGGSFVAGVSATGLGVFNAGIDANHAGIINAGNISQATALTLGSGTPITKIAEYEPTLTPSAVGATTVAEQTFTVSGLTASDKVYINPPSTTAGVGIAGVRVSAADTLAIAFVNPTGSPVTPPSGTYKIIAIRS